MAYNIDKVVLFILYGLKNRSRETGLMYLGYNEVSFLYVCLFTVILRCPLIKWVIL